LLVKEGYKETEIGVIPENWGLTSAKNLMKIETGSRNTEHKSDNGKYLFFVRSKQVEHIDSYHYDCEAVLTAGDGVGTGKVFHYINGKFDAHQRVYVMSQFKEISGKFFYNYFKENFGNEVAKYTAKSSVDSVRRDMIAEMLIPVPSPEEQQKIAEVLSDMDNLISSLEKLIEKKKAIKQGAMQELLSGKKRLPGFCGKWENISLCKLSKIITKGTTPTSIGKEFTDIGINFIKIENISKSGKIDLTNIEHIDEETNKLLGRSILQKDDILFSIAGALGRIALVEERCLPANTNQALSIIRIEKNKCNLKYLYYYLQSEKIKRTIQEINVQGAQSNLSLENISNLMIDIPKDIDEQATIASILFDIYNEIETLEQKLAKCQKLKQGMTQQLLTGKIRLVSNNDVVTDNPEVDTLKVSPKGHNHQFDDAVVIAGIVDKFYSDKYYLGRKKVQKLLYLFRRHQEADTSAFKKKVAGPYADEVRYKGGEPIAISSEYISVKRGAIGSSFSKGEKIDDALNYLENWNLNDDLKWLCEQFKYIKTDRLELLATIDMAMCDLTDAGITVTVESIKNLIKSHSEWKAKLSKSYFKDNDIAWAIRECKRLFN